MNIKTLLTCVVMVASFFWSGIHPFVLQELRDVIKRSVDIADTKNKGIYEDRKGLYSKLVENKNSIFYPLVVEIEALFNDWLDTRSQEKHDSSKIREAGLRSYLNDRIMPYLRTCIQVTKSRGKLEEFTAKLKEVGFNSAILDHVIERKLDFGKRQKLPSDLLKYDFFLAGRCYFLSIYPYLLIHALTTTLEDDLSKFANKCLEDSSNPFLVTLKKKLEITNVVEKPVTVVVPQEVSKSSAEEVDQSIQSDQEKPSQNPQSSSAGACSSGSSSLHLPDPAKSDSQNPCLVVRGEKAGESRQIPMTVFPKKAIRQPKKAPMLECLLRQIVEEEKNRPKPNQPNNIPEQKPEPNEPSQEIVEDNSTKEYQDPASSTVVGSDRDDFFDALLSEVKEDVGYESEEEWPVYKPKTQPSSEVKSEPILISPPSDAFNSSFQPSPPVGIGRWESVWQQMPVQQVSIQAPASSASVIYILPPQGSLPQLYPCPTSFTPPQQNHQPHQPYNHQG